jgi:DNA repair exonuclease SbcCD ATPase subunit
MSRRKKRIRQESTDRPNEQIRGAELTQAGVRKADAQSKNDHIEEPKLDRPDEQIKDAELRLRQAEVRKADAECEKLHSEQHKLNRESRWYSGFLSPAGIAILVALGGLATSFSTGWFDAQSKLLESNRNLLKAETTALTQEKKDLEREKIELEKSRRALTNENANLDLITGEKKKLLERFYVKLQTVEKEEAKLNARLNNAMVRLGNATGEEEQSQARKEVEAAIKAVKENRNELTALLEALK